MDRAVRANCIGKSTLSREITTCIISPMKVYIEKQMEPHDPGVYRADGDADSVAGWEMIDAAALDRYDEQGFLVVRNGLPPASVAAAMQELGAMTEAEDPGCQTVYFEGLIREELGLPGFDPQLPDTPEFKDLTMSASIDSVAELPRHVRSKLVRKFMGFVDFHPPLAAIANHPSLIEAVTRIVGEPVRLFQDMAMIKPPGGREKPWHQDHAYFNLPLDTRVVAVWAALSDVTVANGCMHVIPGGHRAGPRVHFVRRDWQICDEHVIEESRLAVPMSAGDLMLFDGKLPHGTPTNQTDEQRWALQLHYIPQTASEVEETLRLETFGSEGKNVIC